MKKKFIAALVALFVLSFTAAVFAYTQTSSNASSAHSCPMKNAGKTGAQPSEYAKITFSDDSDENCCGTGADCCKGGSCCKRERK